MTTLGLMAACWAEGLPGLTEDDRAAVVDVIKFLEEGMTLRGAAEAAMVRPEKAREILREFSRGPVAVMMARKWMSEEDENHVAEILERTRP